AWPIYVGSFDSAGALVFSKAGISATADTAKQPLNAGYVSLDSCAAQAGRMYASVYDFDGKLFDLLRSDDAGANWYPLSKTFDDGDPNNTIVYWTDLMGTSTAGGWIKHIAVSPTNPDVVSVPGLAAIKSLDGGTT